ncbi:MAG: MarR family transcriptional regulator [Planctomycetes bacterium]|nr:MarR family transcriptional regulator [Planctomycetota bacterium]
MTRDRIDLLQQQWRSERPELDPTPMAVVGRVLRLAKLLEASLERALQPFELAAWEFDVLATLRRHGAPYRMSATRLATSSMLTSGAMTNRIDRLEQRGLVERLADPNDRRGVVVALTPRGIELVEQAVAARFEEAAARLAGIAKTDRERLAQGLRRMLLAFPGEALEEAPQPPEPEQGSR